MTRIRVPFAAVVAGLSIVGGAALGHLTAQAPTRQDVRLRVYTAALSAIEQEYVEPVENMCATPTLCGSEALIYGSIDGMLHTLDPHSSFYSPEEFARMRERQAGVYFGIGIQIVSVSGDVTVTSLFEGSPAYRVGMRRGDIIAKVGAEDAKGWSTEDVVKRVKGPKGTFVDLIVRRPGLETPLALRVERDEIKIATVQTAFMIAPGTGYIRLHDFAETTNAELGEALNKLKGSNLQRLVLDLRDNPGGPLNQAIDVASRFLQRGMVVVSTRGRIPNSDEDYRVTQQGTVTNVPLIVLVNRNSASASEIVTGAMQDHDRGLVVGETTFGKALVQSVYPISNGAGLALTTGRYYTPSGRMIQRPWDTSFDDYLTYQQRDQSATHQHSASEQKPTDGGRKVYGGGGIEPDHFVAGPTDGFNPTRFARALASGSRQFFAGFAERFASATDTRPGAKSAAAHRVEPGWALTDAMADEFHQYLIDQRVRVDEDAFKTDVAFIRATIHYEVDIDLFGIEEARRTFSKVDPQLLAALGFFDDAEKLLMLNTSGTGGRTVNAPAATAKTVR